MRGRTGTCRCSFAAPFGGRPQSVPCDAPSEGAGPVRTAAIRAVPPLLAAFAIAAAASTVSGSAIAGDLYLRAGFGLDRPVDTVFADLDCSSTSPAALYGCGLGGDGAPYRSRGGFRTVPALQAGVGYVVGPAARFEVLVELRPHLDFEGRANFLEPDRRQEVTADLSAVSAMFAGHVDLPGLGLPRLGPFDPFVGAGAGVVRTRIGETRMMFPRTTTIVPGARRTGFAWMLTAGLATALSERATLEFAWRYTDRGTVRTGRGEGRVVWRDGSREPLLLDLAATRARLRSHGLRVSLRYAF